MCVCVCLFDFPSLCLGECLRESVSVSLSVCMCDCLFVFVCVVKMGLKKSE